ncbi:hypothetical protein STEG23_013322, partial [Scotinomys teguina]
QLLRLKMFREDHGSWMTMFFSTILFLFLFSHIYNTVLLMDGNMGVPCGKLWELVTQLDFHTTCKPFTAIQLRSALLNLFVLDWLQNPNIQFGKQPKKGHLV